MEVTGSYIPHLSQVMVYGSFADPNNAGMSQTFTCTAKFDISDRPMYATEYNVQNYYGGMTFLKGSAIGKIDELNTEDLLTEGPWTSNAEPLTMQEKFGKIHTFSLDSQRCTVARPVGLNDGISDPRAIMDLKEGVPYMIQTGYKIWSSENDETINYEEDGQPFELLWTRATMMQLSALIVFISYLTY